MILLVNACVRKESRTKKLTDRLLKQLGGDVEEVVVSDISFPAVDEKFLEKRDELIAKGNWENPLFTLAKQFSRADTVVVAALLSRRNMVLAM